MIERKNDQEYDDHIVCIIDKLYRVSLYIKALLINNFRICLSILKSNFFILGAV